MHPVLFFILIQRIACTLYIYAAVSDDRTSLASTSSIDAVWRQYCQLHGCNFTLISIPKNHGFSSFFAARWHYILHNMMLKSSDDWFLPVDIDTVVANMSRSLNAYMNSNTTDVYFQVRENHEIIAGMMLLKNSKFVVKFIAKWISKSYEASHAFNSDNGDLIQTILEEFHPSRAVAQRCSEIRSQYPEFIRCFENAFTRIVRNIRLRRVPVRFWYPYEGIWRAHESNLRNEQGKVPNMDERLHAFCWRNDFMIHGWKMIHTMWNFTGSWPDIAPGCSFRDDELDTARECCLWKYQFCEVNGLNVCRRRCNATCSTARCAMGIGRC